MLVCLLESSQPFALANTIIEQHERDLHSFWTYSHCFRSHDTGVHAILDGGNRGLGPKASAS